MNCPHCGAEVIVGNTFCQTCRKRVLPPGASPAPAASPSPYIPPAARSSYSSGGMSFERPGAITTLAVLDILFGLPCVLLSAMFVLFLPGSPSEGMAVVFVMVVIMVGIGLLHLIAGIGLLRMQPWGRIAQIVLAALWCLWIPLGTVCGVLVLIYLLKPGAAILFSGRSPQDLAPEEQQQLDAALRGTGLLVGAAVVMGLLVGVMMIGIIAAIAIPSLLRARVSANESSALGDLRTVVSAQAAYADANAGQYDTLECLMAPSKCIPQYPSDRPTFLDANRFAQTTRQGYVFTLHPGTPSEEGQQPMSPSSASSYAYVAVPVSSNRSGVRTFCADASGMICAWREPVTPTIEGGTCPVSCPRL